MIENGGTFLCRQEPLTYSEVAYLFNAYRHAGYEPGYVSLSGRLNECYGWVIQARVFILSNHYNQAG